MNEQDVAIGEFLAERYEILDQLKRDLVTIENDPRNRLTLDRIFPTIHSVKGACGFLAYPRLEAVAHSGEGLLCRLRDGELEWRPPITSGLLALSDAMVVRRFVSPKIRALVPLATPTVGGDQKDERGQRDLVASRTPSLPGLVNRPVEILAIGTSTGGPNALAAIIPNLPAEFSVPIVIVQHMPPLFTAMPAERLASKASITVSEAKHGDLASVVWGMPGFVAKAGLAERVLPIAKPISMTMSAIRKSKPISRDEQ